MSHSAGESETGVLRLDFDRRLKLEFHGSKVTSDAGLLPFRELDDALGLTEVAGERLADPRTEKNGRHGLTGLLRQSTFGRLGGYEDVNDAERLGRDPAMRRAVGGNAVAKQAASASQMGRFETEFLATDNNIAALAYNLANFMRTLALPKEVEHWSLTTIPEKLVKIGAKVVAHGRYVTFQMAEVAIPRPLFAEILHLIDGLRPAPLPP